MVGIRAPSALAHPTPGVGKTSVVDHYHRLHPPRETDTANCQPVLKVTLQPVWKKGSGVNGTVGGFAWRWARTYG